MIVSSQLRGDLQHVSDILTLFVLHRKLFSFLNSSLFDSLELSVDHIIKLTVCEVASDTFSVKELLLECQNINFPFQVIYKLCNYQIVLVAVLIYISCI